MYLKEAAAYLGKAPFTLQSWDRAGKLKAHRTANNRRFYYQSELDQYLGLDHNEPIDKRKIIAYAMGIFQILVQGLTISVQNGLN